MFFGQAQKIEKLWFLRTILSQNVMFELKVFLENMIFEKISLKFLLSFYLSKYETLYSFESNSDCYIVFLVPAIKIWVLQKNELNVRFLFLCWSVETIYLLVSYLLYAWCWLWWLLQSHYQLTLTSLFGIQKMWNYKAFLLDDTKLLNLLVQLPYPSRTQYLIYSNSSSTLVFPKGSILSASTEPFVCVYFGF